MKVLNLDLKKNPSLFREGVGYFYAFFYFFLKL